MFLDFSCSGGNFKFAHPPVNLEAIQTQILDDFTKEEKKNIQDIIRMTEKVNVLMQAKCY